MSTEVQDQPAVVAEGTSVEKAPVESTPAELLERGTSQKDSEEAVDLLSQALELIVIKHGELHPSTARYYHEYGRRLIESSKRDQDVFAKIESQVKNPEEEKQEQEAEDDKTEPPAAAAAVAAEEGEKPAKMEVEDKVAAPTDEKEAEPPSGKQEAPTEFLCGKQEAPAETSSECQTSAEMIEARELAWQLLETARVVYCKDEAKNIAEIASVHCLLGDVAMEDGNFQRAYPEYGKATQMYGKHAGMADRRLGGAHQLAGLCALYDQQNEASIFHYTAAAEAFNNALTELLVKEGVMETPNQDSEDIEFVDEELLEKLKEKLGDDNENVKKAYDLNGIVNNLIERVEEIQDQMEADAQNPQMKEIIMKLGQQIAEKFKNAQDSEGASAFDKPSEAASEGATEVNVLVPKKRPAPEEEGAAGTAAKRQKLETSETS